MVWYVLVSFSAMAFIPSEALASFIPSEQLRSLLQGQRQQDLATVQKVLEQQLIRQRLAALGLTQEQTTLRLAQLDDDQLHELAQQIDQLQAGGDGLGIAIGVVLLLILVIVLVYLLTGRRLTVK
jgi:hypothetical protein